MRMWEAKIIDLGISSIQHHKWLPYRGIWHQRIEQNWIRWRLRYLCYERPDARLKHRFIINSVEYHFHCSRTDQPETQTKHNHHHHHHTGPVLLQHKKQQTHIKQGSLLKSDRSAESVFIFCSLNKSLWTNFKATQPKTTAGSSIMRKTVTPLYVFILNKVLHVGYVLSLLNF